MPTPALLLLLPLAVPQVVEEEAALITSDTTKQLGQSSSLSGSTVLVGDPHNTDPGAPVLNHGAAYLFARARPPSSGWSLLAKLLASDPSGFDRFGYAVGLDGDVAIVGAYGDDLGTQYDAGSVYVFQGGGSTWNEQAKLAHPSPQFQDRFGFSVAVSGNTIVVGAPYDNHAGGSTDEGSVFVYVSQGGTWTLQATLEAGDKSPFDSFGYSVAIDGDTIAVGAPFADGPAGIDGGAGYVFVRNGTSWTEQGKLCASGAQIGDRAGEAIGVHGDTVLLGAPFDDHTGGATAGSALVFVRVGSAWSEQVRLTGGDTTDGDRCGTSVALYGEAAVIGAPLHDTILGADAGAVYVFERTGTSWGQGGKVATSDAQAGDTLGWSVSLDGEFFTTGSPGRVTAGLASGAGHAFRLCLEAPTSYCTAGTSSAGCTVTLGATGTPSASASSGFIVTATGAPLNVQGHFYWGTSGRQARLWGSGTSYQCVVPPLQRGPLLSVIGGPGSCNATSAHDLNAHWTAKPQQNPGAGACVQAQFWYLDTLATSQPKSALSDALEFVVAP